MDKTIQDVKKRIINDYLNGEGNWEEFCDYMNEIRSYGDLDENLARIITERPDTLTPNQWIDLYHSTLEYYYVGKCAIGGEEIPWRDMYDVFDASSLCSDCQKKVNDEFGDMKENIIASTYYKEVGDEE
ncbi:hypothetical protein [Bacillus mycoides]|uniref:hypothetical protein n=1 Tax=Bacillus mycoides TaxID=1405 RepID=UPI0011A850A4|nr:hypothetical protein [Bacillus mycoides]